jgi:hypothetical protein
MAINATTLSAAITDYQTQFAVGSTTGMTPPVQTTGSGLTYLLCESEMMQVTAVPVSGTVQVVRGVLGTMALAHVTSSGVLAGLVTDFPNYVAKISTESPLLPDRFSGVSAVVASAATIVAPGPLFHVSGNTATNIITPPANFVEGMITIIADGVWTFTSSAVTNGIAATGTVTTAKSAVSFVYDAATALWYPTRLS